MFPQVEPIPLPAPVWLFKVLDVVTVSLHFVAVQLLIGGLLIGVVWALTGRLRRQPVLTDAAGNIVTRLPILMVYVINLGVPPLLFAQVLYGRAIYTSSILIGVAWISVIFLLMLDYSLLYIIAGRARTGRLWGHIALVSLVVTGFIALIYSTNMTLMLRPQTWTSMYRVDPLGTHLNAADPTVLPRWLLMVCGGLATGGVGLVLLGMLRTVRAETGQYMQTWGGRIAAFGIIGQITCGTWAVLSQPADVKALLSQATVYRLSMGFWLVLATLVLVIAIRTSMLTSRTSWRWPGLLGVVTLLEVIFLALSRSGVQDLSLLARGMDVWDRNVVSNWLVTSLFLVLFVVGLLVLGWLAVVVARAKKVEQHYV